MEYIITENKLNKVSLSWMNQNFSPDQLEIVKSENYPEVIFFQKDGNVVMSMDNSRGKDFWFDYEKIWSLFEVFFNMGHEQIKEVLSYWLDNTLKVHGYRPMKKMKFFGL